MKIPFGLSGLCWSLVLAFQMVGCAQWQTRPLYQVEHAPLETATAGVSIHQLGQRIKAAGTGLGWRMVLLKPGVMMATLKRRKRMAQVRIAFTQTTYHIAYQDSHHLNYDGTLIHDDYNKWVRRLEDAIQRHVY